MAWRPLMTKKKLCLGSVYAVVLSSHRQDIVFVAVPKVFSICWFYVCVLLVDRSSDSDSPDCSSRIAPIPI